MKKRDILIGLAIAVLVALALSPFASSFPDGLEKVAEELNFIEKGEGEPIVKSPIPDYTMPNVKNEKLATSAAGVLGTVGVFGAAYAIATLLRRKKD